MGSTRRALGPERVRQISILFDPLREPGPSGGSLEQPHAELLLELSDRTADRRLWHAGLARDGAEAAARGDLPKEMEAAKTTQVRDPLMAQMNQSYKSHSGPDRLSRLRHRLGPPKHKLVTINDHTGFIVGGCDAE